MEDYTQAEIERDRREFGVCPHCHGHDGYVNVGREHWFVCVKHWVRWPIAYERFSTWQYETDEMRDQVWARVGWFEEVEPVYFE